MALPSGSATVTISPPPDLGTGIEVSLPPISYRTACTTVWQKPWWQGRPRATLWQGVMGDALDAQVDGLVQARAVAYPNVPSSARPAERYACPSDALYLIGAERGLEQVPGESEGSWRNRLQGAWDWWHHAGTQAGHVEEFGWYGLTNVRVVRRHEWSTPPAVGSNYVQAFAQTVWSQFDVCVQFPHPWKQKLWGDGWKWGDGTTWGSTATATDIAYFKRQVRQFKGAHDTCTYLYLSFVHGRMWGAFKWGDGGLWGGTGQTLAIIVGEQSWGPRGLL